MGRPKLNRIGKKFGKLVTIGRTEDRKYTCLCECGNTKSVQYSHLAAGYVNSCGCINKSKISDKYTYNSWASMVQRCNNPNNSNFFKYGGVGIYICDRWNPKTNGNFQNFLEDMGSRPAGMTLNRIGSCKIYSKETCEWATIGDQSFDRGVSYQNEFGISGIRWRSERQSYESRISKDNKQFILYYGTSLEDAIKARLNAEQQLYPTLFERKYHHYKDVLDKLNFNINIKKELENE